MPSSKVIRIDEQVWTELQKLARPLEDTPNSVLRRVLGLPQEGRDEDATDPRVSRLLELVASMVGETPQIYRVKKDYSFLSRSQDVVAYIRPQHQKLRVGTARESAQSAALGSWDREKRDGFFGGPSVRWYIPDGDEAGYQQAAEVLERLWKLDLTQ
jgi:hypothetical protein